MINNYNLELFLMNHFKKNIKDISKDEFDKLEEISLDGIDISGIYEIIDFKHILDIFPNIKSLVINNYVFTEEDLIEINRNDIIEYSFYKCDFTNVLKYNILNHTKNLLFERCIFNDYDFLNSGFDNLEILCISNPADEEEINLKNVSCIHLKELYLEGCIVNDFNTLERFRELTFLNILGTKIAIDDLNFFVNCPKLECVCVSERFINSDVISLLNKKGISVKFNNNDILLEREEL